MNYTYDIYLNFNKIPYDFFDWNKNDKLLHIKKIPTIKVNTELFKKIISSEFIIDKDLLLFINNKTELFSNKNNINGILFTNNEDIITVLFDNNGKSIKKSFLYIDEELDVLEEMKQLKEKEIKVTFIKSETNRIETRKQTIMKRFIKSELSKNDIDRLKYIYYECFGKILKSERKILNELNNLQANSKEFKKMYDVLLLTTNNKNVI